LAYAPMLVMRRALATHDVPTIRGVFGMSKTVGPLIPVFFLIGLACAVVAIVLEGFNPLEPWLLFAYALFAVGLYTGSRISGPWVGRVAALAVASPDAAPTAELVAAMDDRRAEVTFYVETAVVTLILFDMIVKPFL
jgi:hypothetical protein